MRYKANLELATTRELIEEIKTRGEVTLSEHTKFGREMYEASKNLLEHLPEELLNYRPVDGL